MGPEKNVLDRIDVPPVARKDGDAAIKVMILPVLFVCQGENMRGMEGMPVSKFSQKFFFLGHQTALISFAYFILEWL